MIGVYVFIYVTKKPPQLKGGFCFMQALLDDFRTFDWAKEVPYPDVMLSQIKEFL
jgi:hypothetical protein